MSTMKLFAILFSYLFFLLPQLAVAQFPGEFHSDVAWGEVSVTLTANQLRQAPNNAPPPTAPPTREPTRQPTRHPTRKPTRHPTRKPTRTPTRNPTPNPTLPPRCLFCPDGNGPPSSRKVPLDYVGGTATCAEYDALVNSFDPPTCPYGDVRLDVDFGAYCGCGGSTLPATQVCTLCNSGLPSANANLVVKGLTCTEWDVFARASVVATICRGPFFTDSSETGPRDLCCSTD